MLNKSDKDLELIDEAMSQLIQAMSRPKAWDSIVARARISIDRPGAALLHILEKSGACRPHDLAAKLGVEAPSVTRKVKQLEDQALVRRIPDLKDGRAFQLEITAEGRKMLNSLVVAKKSLFREALQDWPEADRKTFAELFYRLSQDLTKVRTPKQ